MKIDRAYVVGAGPNGLAAAITLARAGVPVHLIEAAETVGGGCRSAALTGPGAVHDVCAAVHPLARASRFFRGLPSDALDVQWIDPPIPVAHPLDDGTAVVLHRSVEQTAAGLGSDRDAYRRLFADFVTAGLPFLDGIIGPLRIPADPVRVARFGLLGLRSARALAESRFAGQRARALFAGSAAHSMLPLEQAGSAAIGLVLGILAHLVGWPIAAGGSQQLPDAMAAYLRRLGGTIETGRLVTTMPSSDPTEGVLFDLAPRHVASIARDRLPGGYRRTLTRFRHGPGSFKVDFLLDGPVPWRAAECGLAGTVHLGGTFDEIAASERAVCAGRVPERPFVLVSQQSRFDRSRVDCERETLWAYCHVPANCSIDMTERIVTQIERFAPGFRDCIVSTSVMGPGALEQYNRNYIGGDIGGGAQDLRQLFTRPAPRWDPYRTPDPRIMICSASTPPGGGVHGLCGYEAAQSLLRQIKR